MTFYRILISILTSLIIGVLFCISFVVLGIAELSIAFFVETGIILVLSSIVRIMWFYDGQRQALQSENVIKAKTGLNSALQNVTDTDDFDTFCSELSEQNRKAYIYSKVGTLTENNFEPNIFEKIIMKLYKYSKVEMLKRRRAKAERSSNKKKFIVRSTAILAGTECEYISVKNKAKGHNFKFFVTTIFTSAISSVLFALIDPRANVFSWDTLWRFLMWTVNILLALTLGWYKGRVVTADEYIAYYSQANDVVQRYIQRCKKRLTKVEIPVVKSIEAPITKSIEMPVAKTAESRTADPIQISIFDKLEPLSKEV